MKQEKTGGFVMHQHLGYAIMIVLLSFALVELSYNPQVNDAFRQSDENIPEVVSLPSPASEAAGHGTSRQVVLTFSRMFDSQVVSVLNSYSNTSVHQGELDLSKYQVSGWTLYNVTMEITNLTAAPERCVIGGDNGANYEFTIERAPPQYYDSLMQGFYNQTYRAMLLNYSFLHCTPTYDSSTYGDAFVSVLSDYSSGKTNLSNYVSLEDVGSTMTWKTVSTMAELLPNVQYYVVINGSSLIKTSDYPEIRWAYLEIPGNYDTREHSSTAGWDISSLNYEAALNYTYLLWDNSTNAPLIFNDPQIVSLTANNTAMFSSQFKFTSESKNITQIHFNSNQSVYIYHNLTLWYKRTATSSCNWMVLSSGALVEWNSTFSAPFPNVSNVNECVANLSKSKNWNANGLYESQAPSTNHTSFEEHALFVILRFLSAGTWTLTATAHNHVTNINTLDSVMITKSPVIMSYVRDVNSFDVTTGTTNMTIYHQGLPIWKPANKTVANGATSYTWDIDSTTTDNGIYTIEVYWTNGTEAGYLTRSVLVYYPTELTADKYYIDAFTDSTFDVRVYFNETFTPHGLTGSSCTVTYSFGSIVNGTMVDLGNGTWAKTVDTSGMIAGTYQLTVYAEGYALENQSISFQVRLIYETLSLSVSWSNQNNITYLQNTNLTVQYRFVNGTIIRDAIVNVTDGTNIWALNYDTTNQYYWIQFNGSDSVPGFGSYSLNVTFWKYEHQAQFNDTLSLIIREEPTTFTVQWSIPYQNNITYLQQTNLTVLYQLTDGTNITGAWVNVTDGTNYWKLHYDIINQYYWIQFNGSDMLPGFGTWQLNISAWKYKHLEQYNDTTTLTIRLEQTNLSPSWTSKTIDWTQSTILVVNYTDSSGILIPNAEQLDLLVNGTIYTFLGTNGTYWFEFNNSLDLGHFIIECDLRKYGYEPAHIGGVTLDIIEAPTNLLVYWAPANITVDYTQILNIQVEYKCYGQDVPDVAKVNVTINGRVFELSYTGTIWNVSIHGIDIDIGVYDATVQAWLYGYEFQTNITYNVNITLAPNSFLVYWTPDSMNATYFEQLELSVIYTNNNTPTVGADVNLYVNSTDVYDLVYSAIDERWHLTIDARSIGLGTWNVTIVANKTGYDSGVNIDILRISPDPCNVTTNWSSREIYYTHQTNLNVSVEDSFGNAISDAIVNVTFDGQSFILPHLGGGVYQLAISGSVGIGNTPISIEVYRYAIVNRSLDVVLKVIETPTIGDVDVIIGGYDNSTLYFDGWIEFNVTLRDIDDYSITGIIANITIGTEIYYLTELDQGNYILNITADFFGIGQYSGVIRADIYGFTGWNASLEFEILPIPTRVIFHDQIPSIMHVNQTSQVSFEFIDLHSGQVLYPSTLEVTWAFTGIETIETSYAVFQFTLSAIGLDIGNHILNITLYLKNYSSLSVLREVTIRLLYTSLDCELSFSQYEHEFVLLAVTFNDLDRNIPISWGEVTVAVNGETYDMLYDVDNEDYILDFYIDLVPRNYVIRFIAAATGCEPVSRTSTLIVMAKTLYDLDIDVGQAIEGTVLAVDVTLTKNSEPIPNKAILVHFRTTMGVQNKTVITNTQGVAEATFVVPSEISNVTVWAEFMGSSSEWAVSTQLLNLPVSPPVNVVAEITGLLIDTLAGKMLIIAFIVGVLVAAIYSFRIKPKRELYKEIISQNYEYFKELASIQHLLLIYFDRGGCISYHQFTQSRLNADLISGFITAINDVYFEIGSNEDSATLESINYRGLTLNNVTAKYLVGVLIMKRSASSVLMRRFEEFVNKVEEKYSSVLYEWGGQLYDFDQTWIVETFYESIKYYWALPHKIVREVENTKYSTIIEIIKSIIDEEGFFILSDVIAEMSKGGMPEEEALDFLISMRNENLITHILNSNTIREKPDADCFLVDVDAGPKEKKTMLEDEKQSEDDGN